MKEGIKKKNIKFRKFSINTEETNNFWNDLTYEEKKRYYESIGDKKEIRKIALNIYGKEIENTLDLLQEQEFLDKFAIEHQKFIDNVHIKRREKPFRKDIFVIARSKIDKENYYISENINEDNVLKLFELAGVVNKNDKTLKEDKFEKCFNLIGLEGDISNYKLFVYENNNEFIWEKNNMNYDNHHKVFRQNYKDWYLKLDGITEDWEYNKFQYKYFVNKKNKGEIKNFYFILNLGPNENYLPEEDFWGCDLYEFYHVDDYWKDLENYEKELNEAIIEDKIWDWNPPIELANWDFEDEEEIIEEIN